MEVITKNKYHNDPDVNGKYNYIYKITNLINNKIYIGVHRTNVLDDGYMGSGKIIKRAIKKYGLENFKKEILNFYDTYKEVLEEEKKLVTISFINQKDVYNLKEGGFGSCKWSQEKLNQLSLAAKKRWQTPEYVEK